MFTLVSLHGNTPGGALQPNTIDISISGACPANSPVTIQVSSSSGSATLTTQMTPILGTNYATGQVPAWAGLRCGDKMTLEVTAVCNSAQIHEFLSDTLDCRGCPRISIDTVTAGVCSGTPLAQQFTLAGTVMIAPGSSEQVRWSFGDGTSSAAIPITNHTNDWNTPFLVTIQHDYADRTQDYNVCLESINSECPKACAKLKTTCANTPPCPTMSSVTAAVGACNPDRSRTITLTFTATPPLPAGTSAQILWAYGASDVHGNFSATQTITAGSAPITQTVDLWPRSAGYDITATLFAQLNNQPCPISGSTAHVHLDVGACLPCPDSITIVAAIPNGPNWCAPVTVAGPATLSATVDWPAGTALAPQPASFSWHCTGPTGLSSHGPGAAVVTTSSGWSGPGALAGGSLDLSRPGTYTFSVVAVFDPASGLPAGCVPQGETNFSLQPCQSHHECPGLTGISSNAGCVDTSVSPAVPAQVSLTASIDDPAGLAKDYTWDFGDPTSPANSLTTATPDASHSYAAPGSYTVTCAVSSTDTSCTPHGSPSASATIAVSACGTPGPPPPKTSSDCAGLLWAAMILALIGLVVAIVGCMLFHFGLPHIGLIIGVIGGVIWLIGLILFLIWFAICSALTACSVILSVIDFVIVMIAVFGVIAAVLSILAGLGISSWPCAFAAIISFGYWGAILAILYLIARARGCLVAGSSGSGSSGSSGSSASSSGGLSSSAPVRTTGPAPDPGRAIGLGDVVSGAARAMGMTPCGACERRAGWLNAALPLVGRRA